MWIIFCAIRYSDKVAWNQELMETIPMDFCKYFSKYIIINCFEIFVDRLTSLKACAQTWSNYEHHNSIKVLIGIAPQGAVTIIFKDWGGRVLDVHLTENCGLLDQFSLDD